MEEDKQIKLLMEETQEMIDTFIEFQKDFLGVMAKYMKKRRELKASHN